MNIEQQNNLADRRAVDAEQRINVIRISAIALFYLVHLWHVSAPQLGEQAAKIFGFNSNQPVAAAVHIGVTTLCLGWLMQAFAVHFFIQQQRVADRFAAAVTIGDLFWLTAILCISTGPAGPMVVGYFLILMMSGLRFNLRLVRLTTLSAVVCYLALLAVARWPVSGFKEIAPETVPRYHQLMVLLALVIGGVLMGQIVRHAYVIGDTNDGNQKGQP